MFLVRDVFHAKPGKAKEIVKKFKQAQPFFEKQGMKGFRIMTDIVAAYWTVVFEIEVDDLGEYAREIRGSTSTDPELAKIMEGYMDLVTGGYREIFLIE